MCRRPISPEEPVIEDRQQPPEQQNETDIEKKKIQQPPVRRWADHVQTKYGSLWGGFTETDWCNIGLSRIRLTRILNANNASQSVVAFGTARYNRQEHPVVLKIALDSDALETERQLYENVTTVAFTSTPNLITFLANGTCRKFQTDLRGLLAANNEMATV